MTESRIEKQRKQINEIINFLNDTDLHYEYTAKEMRVRLLKG